VDQYIPANARLVDVPLSLFFVEKGRLQRSSRR